MMNVKHIIQHIHRDELLEVSDRIVEIVNDILNIIHHTARKNNSTDQNKSQ